MTALNIICTPSKALIFTDSIRSHLKTEIALGYAHKVLTAPHARLCIAGRGTGEGVLAAASVVALAFRDIDAAEAGISGALGELFGQHPEWLAPMRLEVAVVGWSPKRNAMALFVCDSASGFAPRETTLVIGPEIGNAEMQAAGLAVRDGAIQFGTDLRSDFVKMTKAQRHRGGEGIGGHIVETEITQDQIRQRIVYEWTADKIGEPLEPYAPGVRRNEWAR